MKNFSRAITISFSLALAACSVADDKEPNASNPAALTGAEDPTDQPATNGPDSTDPCHTDCPDPDDPRVGYVSQDPEMCLLVDFECEPGAAYFDDECGCGCILPDEEPASCPDPDDPQVMYASEDPEVCMAADLICPEGAEYFDGDCGCGCIIPD